MKRTFDCDMIVSDKASDITSDRKSSMTKADICLVAVIVVTALFIALIFRLNRTPGSYANVTCDGRVLIQIPLTQSEAKYYLLTESIIELSEDEWKNTQLPSVLSDDYNVIVCQDGKVRMAESSCPDQICVYHSAIYASGESIICLPHKVIVEVISDEERELDGVVY